MAAKALSPTPLVDPSASVRDCRLGTYCEVGARTQLLDIAMDVPAYAIVAGNPARVIRHSFPEAIAERLAALQWWDWEHEALRTALPDVRHLAIED